MGKRKARTGAGGAVASSLSKNPGGAVQTNTRRSGPRGSQNNDPELEQLANPSGRASRGSSSGAGPSNMPGTNTANSSLSAPSSTPKWLGKSPQQMLREWCIRNNRKRPFFSKMAGNQGLVRCTIPPGRKDGKKVKGSAFDLIAGVGSRPGDDFAALNVLHQVERGKPLERLLAPVFRDTWLDLDKRFEEVDKEKQDRAANKERRKLAAEKRAKFEKSKEAGTINISSSSRQMIEDALEEQKTATGSTARIEALSVQNDSKVMMKASNGVTKELIGMGFSEFDALHASRLFATASEAVDYLCLNLDESELPPSLAPKADIEVVQFKTRRAGYGIREVDKESRDKLANLICLSQNAAERVLRECDHGLTHAAVLLYNVLTNNVLSNYMCLDPEKAKFYAELKGFAENERSAEGEAVAAIYGNDAIVGMGALSEFPDRWSAVIRIEEGIADIHPKTSFSVAIVDADGLYPFTAPLVLVIQASSKQGEQHKVMLSPPHRRLLMRAIAGELSRLRPESKTDWIPDESRSIPVLVVHSVVSFLSEASMNDLFSSASLESRSAKTSYTSTTRTESPTAAGPGTKSTTTGRSAPARKHLPPKLVGPLKNSPTLEAMRRRRRSLPAHNARTEIINSVLEHQVTVISGATGSGKTTQVPQFLLENASVTKRPMFMICTQPRRIAAISVAERVATERCETVGGTVGYQVKLNSKLSARTRLLFCTTGVLLRRLQGDPELEYVTHVVVDEVHERSVETDFLLLLLREILKRKPRLRVVLMSATLDSQKFSDYFSSALSHRKETVPIVSFPGRTFPVEELYLADAVLLAKYQLRPGSRFAKKVGRAVHHGKYGPEPSTADLKNSARPMSASTVASSYDGGHESKALAQSPEKDMRAIGYQTTTGREDSNTVKETTSLIDETMVNIDLIESLVKRINFESRERKETGAILIFVPGTAEISAVIQRLSSGEGSSKLWPLPLHSLLSPQEQTKVFQKPPKGKRKVICSTNIAETSITVDDVTVVIDTMRAKEMSYDALNGSSVLQECFISKAAAKQRAGRAGRVSKGTCYRLVRKQTFADRIAAQQKPEILRVALEHLVLNILSIIPEQQSKNDPHAFLASAIDPPDPNAVTKAVSNLKEIGALESIGTGKNQRNFSVRLTALGKHLSGLPVDARIGKLLIYGSIFKCIDAALTIAATVSERSPFYAPFDKREEARTAREPFVWGKSDLLTSVKAFDAWRDIKRKGKGQSSEQEFCLKHFLSKKTLQSISEGRKQLVNALSDAGFGPPSESDSRSWEQNPDFNKHGKNLQVLRAVLCAALYPNVARIDLPEKVYRKVAGGSIAEEFASKQLKLRAKTGERLFLHPESVNFHQGNYNTRWLAYFSKVKTTKPFIRETTMVSPYAILLFGGDISVNHQKGQISVDNWVVFKAPARVAVLARELRRELDGLLLRKFEDTGLDVDEEGRSINDVIVKLITTES